MAAPPSTATRPTPVGGLPTTLLEGEVQAVYADGVDVRASSSRTFWSHARVVRGLTLVEGDTVLVAFIGGDPQRPVVTDAL